MPNPDSLNSPATPVQSDWAVRSRPAPASMFQRWHRAAGALAALFLVILAGSGLMLMHADELGLPARQVQSAWLLDWYGVRPPPPPLAFSADGHWLIQLGERIYFDTTEIPFTNGALVGALVVAAGASETELLAITSEAVIVLRGNGQIVERFGAESGLPADVSAAGLDSAGAVILETPVRRYRYTPDTGFFSPTDAAAPVQWSAATAPPPAMVNALTQAYRGAGLSFERVMLDLHSGRLFGAVGTWLVNLTSVLLLFLAGSGLYMWWRRGDRGNREGAR